MLALVACGGTPKGTSCPSPTPPEPKPVARLDPDIAALVKEVSPARIEATIGTLVSFHTRHTLSDPENEKKGIGAARRWIEAEFSRIAKESGGRLQVSLDEFVQPPTARVPKPTTVVNVVATLPGEQPASKDRLYVVSGHYDSRVTDVMDAESFAPGANDDASGTAAVIELARVMSTRKFDATIVFLAVAGEEQGLLGSTHWAENAKSKGLDVAAMISNDIIGSSVGEDGSKDASRVRLFAEGVPPTKEPPDELRTLLQTGGENDTLPRALGRYVKELGERYVDGFHVTLIYRRDRYLRGSDHIPFLERGWAAVRLTEPSEDFRHQHADVKTEGAVKVGDLPQYVDYAYVAQVTRVNVATLASLARAPAAPKGLFLETKKLEHGSTLHWTAGVEPDLSTYRVVWRETTSPVWQHSLEVGKVSRVTVPVSKDDFILGVQAVDAEGHASLAVYPTPER